MKPIEVFTLRDTGEPLTLGQVRDQMNVVVAEPQRAKQPTMPSAKLSRPGTRMAQIGGTDGEFSRLCLINRVAKCPEGERNRRLFGAVKDAARQGNLDERMIDEFVAAALNAGLEDKEIVRTIESAMKEAEQEAEERKVAGGEADKFGQKVAEELTRMRVHEAARVLFEREKAGPAPPLDIIALDEDLVGDEDPAFRVADLIPPLADTVIVAQRKTGKTTLITNLARCLKSGEQFLGRLAVRPIGGRVAILNYELPRGRMRRWCREAGCPHDGVRLVNLRGRRSPLDYEEDREVLAARLRELRVEALIVDPFANASRGVESNSNSEVSQWLGKLEEFARSEVGVLDLIVTVHAGWVNANRSRGASALEDWPDSIINLTADAKTKQRYLKAFGRDVHLDEEQLDYDPATRWLTLSGEGGRQAGAAQESELRQRLKIAALVELVVRFVSSKPGVSAGDVHDDLRSYARANGVACPSHSYSDITEAIKKAENDGQVRDEGGGSGKRKRFFVVPDPDDTRSDRIED